MSKADYERELELYSHTPVGVIRNGGAWPAPRYQFSLAACARWETRYIVEWLTYHRSIGIEHVYLYCNDDDPRALYEKVLPFVQGDNPFVTFRHYSFQGLQMQIYFHFVRNYSHETKWFMLLDIDEFICIRDLNNIPVFMSRFDPTVEAVYFNWCNFGHNGYAKRPDGDVLINYTRRQATPSPLTKVFIKSQSVPFIEFFRRPMLPIMHDYISLKDEIVSRNVLNDDMNSYYKNNLSTAWPYLMSEGRSERILLTAYIAHYSMKSDEDFTLRVERGLKGDYANEKMWGDKNEEERIRHHEATNAVRDTYLHDYWNNYLSKGWENAVFPKADWPLISENRTASQMSTLHNRTPEQDASAILSGRLAGRSQNHTKPETDPWWSVDLGQPFRVHEMRVFNRLDGFVRRMAQFRLFSSDDGKNWTLRHAKETPDLFGGADGTPYRWISPDGFEARWLSLVVPGVEQHVNLDQIQFFGVPAAAPASPAA